MATGTSVSDSGERRRVSEARATQRAVGEATGSAELGWDHSPWFLQSRALHSPSPHHTPRQQVGCSLQPPILIPSGNTEKCIRSSNDHFNLPTIHPQRTNPSWAVPTGQAPRTWRSCSCCSERFEPHLPRQLPRGLSTSGLAAPGLTRHEKEIGKATGPSEMGEKQAIGMRV